jgi:hypothetical protein
VKGSWDGLPDGLIAAKIFAQTAQQARFDLFSAF